MLELHMNVAHFGALFRSRLPIPTSWSIAAVRETAYLAQSSSAVLVIALFPDPKQSCGEFKLG